MFGVLAGALAVAVFLRITRRPIPTPDEQAERRRERLLREYRNFLTYDGFAPQDEGE
jgi:hypothetical protein